jgi:hypothetical protein
MSYQEAADSGSTQVQEIGPPNLKFCYWIGMLNRKVISLS